MKNKKAVKKYFKNLLYFADYRQKLKLFKCRNDVLSILDTIIENNNEYLLTDTYFCYLSVYIVEYILKCLEGLKNTNVADLVPFIKEYVDRLSEENIDGTRLNIFDEDISQIVNAYEDWIYKIDSIPHINDKIKVLNEIFLIIAAYVIIKNKTVEEYNAYINDYIDNLDGKLDELALQNRIFSFLYDRNENLYKYGLYDDNRLAEYLVGKLDDSYKKEIR